MFGRLVKGTLILVIAISFLIVTTMVILIVQNYTDTKQWDVSYLNKEIHTIPPQLAKNYVSLDDQELLELLSNVNVALSEIEKSKGIDPDNLDDYRRLHERASKMQAKLELNDSALTAPIQTLGLYLNIEQAMNTAYSKPDPERFEELTDQLSIRLLGDNKNKMDNLYLDKLSAIAEKYKELDEFITYSLSLLGTIEKGKLTVSPSITKEITNDLVNRISQNNLDIFDNVKRLKELLISPDWEQILQHADAKRRYDAWLEAKKILEALSKSDYISASTFQTYEDVINYGYTAYVEERYGYDIDMKSKVTSITVNGQPVSDDAYFRKNANVQFTIDAEYIYRKPKPTIDTEHIYRKPEPNEAPSTGFDIEYDSRNDETYQDDISLDEDNGDDKIENETFDEEFDNETE